MAAGLLTEGEEVEPGVVTNEYVGFWVPAVPFIGEGITRHAFLHTWLYVRGYIGGGESN